jgi:hypothetical protein
VTYCHPEFGCDCQTGYYPLHDAPVPGDRLTIQITQPSVEDLPQGLMRTHSPGPRTRVIFEGEAQFVDRILEATRDVVTELRDEIEGRPWPSPRWTL